MGSKCTCIGVPENIAGNDIIEIVSEREQISETNKPQEDTIPIQETSLDDHTPYSDNPAVTSQNERVKLVEQRLGPYKFASDDGYKAPK